MMVEDLGTHTDLGYSNRASMLLESIVAVIQLSNQSAIFSLQQESQILGPTRIGESLK